MKIKFESHSFQEAEESVPGYIALLCLRIIHESFFFCIRAVYMAGAKYVEFECMVRMGFHHAARTKEKIGLLYCNNDDDSRDEIFCDQRNHL